MTSIGKPSRQDLAKARAAEKKWQAEADLNTLARAKEIQQDRQRMAAVKSHVKNLAKAVTKKSK